VDRFCPVAAARRRRLSGDIHGDDTRVVLRVPQLGPGSYEIDAVNPASKVAAAGTQLNVLAAGLAVTGAARMCSTTEGRGPMTITGSGFVTGATVTLDGVLAAGAVV